VVTSEYFTSSVTRVQAVKPLILRHMSRQFAERSGLVTGACVGKFYSFACSSRCGFRRLLKYNDKYVGTDIATGRREEAGPVTGGVVPPARSPGEGRGCEDEG
jgi:hypothetical protein